MGRYRPPLPVPPGAAMSDKREADDMFGDEGVQVRWAEVLSREGMGSPTKRGGVHEADDHPAARRF